jgi:hypothetical protein
MTNTLARSFDVTGGRCQKVKPQDIAIINFPGTLVTDPMRKWRQKNAVVMAESCARQIWLGTIDDFKDCPLRADEQLWNKCYFEGREAYRFFFRLMSGLESKKLAETNISGELMRGKA